MDRVEAGKIALMAKNRLAEIRAADTIENEMRLISLLKAKGVVVKRGRQKGPERYTVKLLNGSIGPVSLFDVENIWKKMSGEIG